MFFVPPFQLQPFWEPTSWKSPFNVRCIPPQSLGLWGGFVSIPTPTFLGGFSSLFPAFRRRLPTLLNVPTGGVSDIWQYPYLSGTKYETLECALDVMGPSFMVSLANM